jgi:hypothetical protein
MIDKKDVQSLMRERLESLARYLFPQGRKIGHSWRVGSLDVNLRTGMWGDWDGSTKRMSKNLIDLWIYATDTDFKTAIVEIQQWLGIIAGAVPSPAKSYSKPVDEPKRAHLPLIEKPAVRELLQLSELRSIAFKPLQLAVDREFLWICTLEGKRSWLLTDQTRKLAIARRLDGKNWESIDAKSKTLYGSWGSWPLGIIEAKGYPLIALVEGGPDFLAVIAHAWASGVETNVAPVCMAGGQMAIPESVLPCFVGKGLRIFVHNDLEGRAAASRWFDQLSETAAIIDGYSFDGLIKSNGDPVNDLNDLCLIDVDSWERNFESIENVMNFATERGA